MDADDVSRPASASRSDGQERHDLARSQLPSLKELCTRVVNSNLHSITSFGTMSYDAVRPFLIRMEAQQLHTIEESSPHLMEHTEDLWRLLCMREFVEIRRAYDAGQLDLPGSWRDLYDEAEAAREAKFLQLQEKMKNNYKVIAHEKEAKQIKVINKAPPAKKRAFSSANGRPTAGVSLLQKARKAAAANNRQFGHSSAPTSAFNKPGPSSTGSIARPQQGIHGTALYRGAPTVSTHHIPAKPVATPADPRVTAAKSDTAFFASTSRARPAASLNTPASSSRTTIPKSGIGNTK